MDTSYTDTKATRNDEFEHTDTQDAPNLSAGWREVYAANNVPTSIESGVADRANAIAAATRPDRPERYRRKHALEVSS
ncbi:hypothetical protein ACYJ1Y_16075 [Natrialbaceae archaeon A-gly3]